jgi:hypothetical protein
VTFLDGRAEPPSLGREGVALVERRAAWEPADYPAEIQALLLELSGADAVVVTGAGVKRFGEKSAQSGQLDNSRPARFVHVDISDPTAATFAARSLPQGRGDPRRFAHYNVWRCLTPAPQDVPLGLCDSRSVAPGDLIAADAVFDQPDKPEWSFEGLVIGHNPAHRWLWFPDMNPQELLVFKTNDSDPGEPHCVPHSAFDADVPPGTPPRASIEMRAVAYWF